MGGERPVLPDGGESDGVREISRMADELLPALIARLGVSGLGELEVRQGDRRIRLRREPVTRAPGGPAGRRGDGAAGAVSPGRTETARRVATSPGVGYFAPRGGLAVGQAVAAGDVLGWVDVLGVRQEVVPTVGGVIGRLLAEAGQAVEYGQELVHLDGPGRPDEDPFGDPQDAPGAPRAAD